MILKHLLVTDVLSTTSNYIECYLRLKSFDLACHCQSCIDEHTLEENIEVDRLADLIAPCKEYSLQPQVLRVCH